METKNEWKAVVELSFDEPTDVVTAEEVFNLWLKEVSYTQPDWEGPGFDISIPKMLEDGQEVPQKFHY